MMKKVSMFIENILSYIYYSIYVSLEYNGLFKTSNSWPTVISISGIVSLILTFTISHIAEVFFENVFNYDIFSSDLYLIFTVTIYFILDYFLMKYYTKKEKNILEKMKERQKKIKYKIIIGLCLISIIAYSFFMILI